MSAGARSYHQAFRRTVIPLVFALLGAATNLAAQGQEPLLKSDLVRLLTSGALGNSEIASLITRNCLAFVPTTRDRDQFRELGADDTVMAAMDECGDREREVQATPTRSRITTEVGGVATVVVRVSRGEQPQQGVELALRGSSALPGSGGADAHAFSNNDGNAIFRMPVGTVPGVYRLRVAAAGSETVEATGSVLLVVTAAAGTSAEVTPQQLQVTRGAGGAVELAIVVRDQYGNLVQGAEVLLQPSSPAMGLADATQTTDSTGTATFDIDAAAIRESGRLGIIVGPDQLSSIPVLLLAGAVAIEQTRWVSGTDQSGTVGARLPRPFVLQVRDGAGLPIGNQQVVFTATNARVDPPVANTDTTGSVSAIVSLGNAVTPATVVALVEGQRFETVIQVSPGPAVDLILTLDGSAVEDDLVIAAKDQLTLRVAALDAFGNQAPLTGLQVEIQDDAIVRSLGAAFDSVGGRIVLQPLTDGVTDVTVSAAGLSERLAAQLFLSQRPTFPGYTDLYGSGFIATPHAFIAPGNTDLSAVIGASFPQIDGSRTANEGGSAVFSYRGRLEFGIAAYSAKNFGVPAKAQLLPPGPAGLSLAVGVLNLVPTSGEVGRYGDLVSTNVYDNYLKRATPYLTGSFARRAWNSPVGFLVSVGWGYGFFYVENPEYSEKGYTSGFFGAAALDAEALPGIVFRLMIEHDGWDTNAAGTLMLHGIEVTLGLLAIDEGSAEANSNAVNQMRFFARVGASLNQSRAWLGL